MKGQATTVTEDVLGLHQGEVLLKLASTYPTVTLTAVEAVQNALDADAKNVFVGVDLGRRTLIVLDDGNGVTQDKFRQALKSVGKGVKRPGSLGRFGLGLISPLNKCTRFVFASHPVGAAEANIWSFEGAKIRVQHEKVTIPLEQAKRLPRIPSQFAEHALGRYTQWRSILLLHEITEDKIIGVTDLDELESQVRVKLGSVMRSKGTSVHVVLIAADGTVAERDIDPLEFTGEPLPIAEFDDPQCGHVIVELYRAPRSDGKRSGLVTVMQIGDNTQITMQEFYTQALGTRALQQAEIKAAFDVLRSGYFEGVIRAEKIELAPERNRFMLGQALNALYIAIYLWYADYGQQYYEDEKETRRDQRWQTLGEESLKKVLARLETDKTFAALARQLIGVLPDGKRASSIEDQEQGTSGGTGDGKSKRKRVEAKPPERAPRPQDPRRPRLNFTLRFAYEVLTESVRLWEFNTETGVLTFNVRHPIWTSLDETNGRRTTRNDKQIMHLQEYLTLKLLLMLARHDEPDFDFELARMPVDDEVKLYAAMFISTT